MVDWAIPSFIFARFRVQSFVLVLATLPEDFHAFLQSLHQNGRILFKIILKRFLSMILPVID
jgi:hypothetical protein